MNPISSKQIDLILICLKYLKLKHDDEIKEQLTHLDVSTASDLITAFKANNNAIAISQLQHLKIFV